MLIVASPKTLVILYYLLKWFEQKIQIEIQ